MLLITIILATFILPVIIVSQEYQINDRLLYGAYYLLLFIFILFTASIYHKLSYQIKENKSSEKLSNNFTNIALRDLKFKNNIALNRLVTNLISKKAFKCEKDNLIKTLSNKSPSKKNDINYSGGNGKISYHNLFYTFHYLIEGGIRNLDKISRNEFLNYIIWNFTKNEKEITINRIRQSYKDWLCQTNDNKFNEDFFEIFIIK